MLNAKSKRAWCLVDPEGNLDLRTVRCGVAPAWCAGLELDELADARRDCLHLSIAAARRLGWHHVELDPQITFDRADAETICLQCNKPYRQHPHGGLPGYDGSRFLRLLCNGRLVKI